MKYKIDAFRVFRTAFFLVVLHSASAFAAMDGTWVLVFSDNSSIVVSLDENNGVLTGTVTQYNQPIIGTVYKNGFVFNRSGGGLAVPQFFGGRVSDDGESLFGAFCHSHNDCKKTFSGIKR